MVNFLIILIDLYSLNALILGIFHIKYPSAQGKTQACLDLFANSFKHSVAFSLALSLSLSVFFLQSGQQRSITHLQYVAWPDHGVPEDSSDFLDFVQSMRSMRGKSVPLMVHCR